MSLGQIRVEVRSRRVLGGFRAEVFETPPKPRVLEWVKPALDTDTAMGDVRREAPTGPDVAEWMQEAAAAEAVLDTYAQAVEASGGEVRWRSGDPYIPGVRVDREFYAVSEPWGRVRDRGYGRVRTPCGEARVPVGGKALMTCRDFLGWGVLPGGYWIQWTLALLRWVKLPKLPVTRRTGVAIVYGRTAPFFAEWRPRAPLPLATLRLVAGSEKEQKLLVRARDASDYRRVLWEKELELDQGENEYVLGIWQLPFVAPQVLELQGQDGARLYVERLESMP